MHQRYKQRVGADSPITGRASGGGSAFTSYIAAADLQQAISKYRASGCSEAYYLLTAGVCTVEAAGSGRWCVWLCLCPGQPESPQEQQQQAAGWLCSCGVCRHIISSRRQAHNRLSQPYQ